MPWRQGESWFGIHHVQIHLHSHNPGVGVMLAEQAKTAKHAHLDGRQHFVLLTVETSVVLGPEALLLLWDLGHCLKETTGEHNPCSLSSSACLWLCNGEMQLLSWDLSTAPWT